MKRIHILASLIVVLSAALLLSCVVEPVTPVAYTRFDTSADLTVYYTSNMYYDQIVARKDDFNVYTFSFPRCLGADVMEGRKYTLVDVSRNPDMYVTILSTSEYSPSKSFYLNGQKLVPSEINEFEFGASYRFMDIDGFIRTNPGGTLYPDKVNYIEYK